MSITIYGASDDLIEVEGDIREEFAANDGEVDYLAFSDGTVVTVDYTRDGIWRIAPIRTGTGSLTVEQAVSGDDDNYSDHAVLDGDVQWVVLGKALATSNGR